nr:MAG TPA: hypothetical protein [Caudoviricetes sp.]
MCLLTFSTSSLENLTAKSLISISSAARSERARS